MRRLLHRLFLTLAVALPASAALAAEDDDFLMYAMPLLLKFSDGYEMKITVTARARGDRHDLALSVNDEVVDTAMLVVNDLSEAKSSIGDYIDRRVDLAWASDDLPVSTLCVATHRTSPVWRCSVKSGSRALGELVLDRRLYRSESEKAAAEAATVTGRDARR